MIIEQDLMRLLKGRDGLTHGRGLISSTLARFVLAQPASVAVCSAVEKLCGISMDTSGQHVELRESRQVRDDHDLNAITSWLKSHFPFERDTDKRLLFLASGNASDSTINCDSAVELGLAEYQMTVGKIFPDLKLKRKNMINPL